DLGDLVDVQLCGHARQEVLAVGGGGSQDVAVIGCQTGDQRCYVFRQLVGVGRIVGDQHLGYALDLGSRFADGAAATAGYQYMDVATDGFGRGDGIQGRCREDGVVVFSDNQDSHLDYLRLVLQFLDQFSHGLDLDTGTARGRRLDLQCLHGGSGGDAQCVRGQGFQRLLLGLHDVRQRGVARLVQAQVGGDDRRQVQRDGLQAAVDFTGDVDLVAGDFHLGGEGALGEAGQRAEHLPGLVVVAVDGLLAEDDQLRLLLVDHGLEQLGHGQGIQLFGGLDQDGTIGTQRQRGAQLLLGGGRADGDHDDLARNALFLPAYGFFNGDFAEGVHRHLDVGEVDAGVVRLDADLDVVIDHSFDSYENLHGFLLLSGDGISPRRTEPDSSPWLHISAAGPVRRAQNCPYLERRASGGSTTHMARHKPRLADS